MEHQEIHAEQKLRSSVTHLEPSKLQGGKYPDLASCHALGVHSVDDHFFVAFDDDGIVKDVIMSGDPGDKGIISDEIKKQYERMFPGKTLSDDLSESIEK